MRIREFELGIENEHGTPIPQTPEGYVPLGHGTVYSLYLRNHSYQHANLIIEIDGLDVGHFQLAPGQWANLEHPVASNQRFTFFASDSPEAEQSGETEVAKDKKGLVQVTFTPGTRRSDPPTPSIAEGCAVMDSWISNDIDRTPVASPRSQVSKMQSKVDATSGITGLTGNSSQIFDRAVDIVENPARRVTISLRLVCSKQSDQPNPLPGRFKSNPVPEPV